MLKRINDALPELILGILIYEIVVEFTGIWFVKDKLGYSNGLLIGAATAIGMAIHMAGGYGRIRKDKTDRIAVCAAVSRSCSSLFCYGIL